MERMEERGTGGGGNVKGCKEEGRNEVKGRGCMTKMRMVKDK